MSNNDIETHHLNDLSGGVYRKLAEGLSTTIFPGEKSMLSIVKFEPEAKGEMHQHPEEQWGLMLEGDAIRYQGDIEFKISKGDFWRTAPNVPHTMKAGKNGALVLDIFAPIRPEYLVAGEGFGS